MSAFARDLGDDLGFSLSYLTHNITVVGQPVGPFAMNQYIVVCNASKIAGIVDSGSADVSPFIKYAARNGLTVTHLLQTHGHVDHVAGLSDTKKQLPNALIYLHPKEKVQYYAATLAGKMYGFPCPVPPAPDVLVEDNTVISLGQLRLKVLFTPGHSPGHICFYEENEDVLFGGDMVFQGSVGRTDFPLCNGKDMIQSLKRLMALPNKTTIFPGHMGLTTIGTEHENNPYFHKYK